MTIEFISASAGSGKTWNLEKRTREAIVADGVRPEAIVGITYTKKAAAELTRRLRRGLLDGGLPIPAARIRDGYLGTVHGVCQRLIADLAFEIGQSPYPRPAPEAYSQQLFRETVATVIRQSMGELRPLAERLGLRTDDSRKGGRWTAQTWRDVLHALVSAGQENRITPAGFQESMQLSLAETTDLLPPPAGSIEDRDRALFRDLPAILQTLQDNVDAEIARKGRATGAAEKRLRWARNLTRRLERGWGVPWTDVVAVHGGEFRPRGLEPLLQGYRNQLQIHLSHPRLHAELAQMITLLFTHASEASAAFVGRKATERLLDFEDMLAVAADALVLPAVQEQLAGRIDLLLVDEFQDTSPVQLQVVFALARLAKRTIWVGDRKQSIFGFQGSDPTLMEAAATAVLQGADPEFLPESYRSRPALVRFCNAVFTEALTPLGFSEREVSLEPACPEPPTLDGAHFLHLLKTDKDPEEPRKGVKESVGIAAHIRAHLDANTWLVRDHTSDATAVAPTRPARPSDIAVLARTNVECLAVAQALTSVGVPARVAQEQLGRTPEALLLRAGLAVLADPGDRIAAAEIAWFSGSVTDPDAWLTERVAAVRAKDKSIPSDAFGNIPAVAAVRAAATDTRHCAPDEAVVRVMDALDLPERVLGWPEPRRHLANLEALRAVAVAYQEICAAKRSAATITGLVHHLENLPDGTPQALPANDEAVHVSTYHKAKGLEWPVVVCANLHKRFSTKVFDVRVEPAPTFDPSAPLAGRTLRWWPWPYGRKSKGLTLHDRAMATDVAARLDTKRRDESGRLLYVGFTRTRDHLCLSSTGSTDWLDELTDAQGNRVLDLPWDAPGDQVVTVGGHSWPCRVSSVVGVPRQTTATRPPQERWFKRPATRTTRPAQGMQPSAQRLAQGVADRVAIAEAVPLGARMQIDVPKKQMNALGDTLHHFFASDPGGEPADREALAQEMLAGSGVEDQIEPADIIEMADRFDAWLTAHTAGARLTEWPVRWRQANGRVLSGDIDLLVDLGEGWLLLDHKSFHLDTKTRDVFLRKWAGQLDAYRAAVERASGKPVLECWVHLPVRSEVVRLEIPRGV